MYFCHHCRNELKIDSKVPFRSECPHCRFALHCCLNCRFYAPGKHNDCAEPGADRVVDKDRANFCEYFAIKDLPGPPSMPGKDKARDAAEALFKK